jgi:hypothetical protein
MNNNSQNHPYYIIAPRYIRTSAGARVLYRLCDLINKTGGSAFIYLRPFSNYQLASSPMDVAPFLTKKTVDYHFENGLTPIVVYPEIFDVTRFNAPVRVRYILNYEGLFCENRSLAQDDYLLMYSQAISDKVTADKPSSICFIPVSDADFFQPPPAGSPRSGGVFYAGKFKYRFGGKTFALTDGMPEITRDRIDSQTPEQIRALFQQSEFFYCYEDSALALEAILCGCPVVFVSNAFFEKPLGAVELDGLGYALGTDTESVRHARNTVVLARERYLWLVQQARLQVDTFIQNTQPQARAAEYHTPFAKGFLASPGLLQQTIDMFKLAHDVATDRGIGEMLRICMKRLFTLRLRLF